MSKEIGGCIYRLIKHSDIHTVRDAWNTLYDHNTRLTPYQEYSYCSMIYKYSAVLKRHRLTNVIYELRNMDDNTIMLIPLHIERTSKGSVAHMWGEFSQSGHLDFIYSDQIQTDALLTAMRLISRDMGNVRFVLTRISEQSRLYDLMQTGCIPHSHIVGKDICVQIPLSTNFNDYLNSLGKNVRQNLRTSFNRLKTDNRIYEVATFVNRPIQSKTLRQLFTTYWNRHSDKGLRIGPKRFLPLWARMRVNPSIMALEKLPNAYHSIVYIDKAVAGFCAGFTSRNGKIILPFLAINSSFSRYSPGAILITESIKFLIKNHDYTYFDLSRGEEQYKYAYGGREHFNYTYEIHLEG